jgi:hypothetical protein
VLTFVLAWLTDRPIPKVGLAGVGFGESATTQRTAQTLTLMWTCHTKNGGY